VEHDSRWLMPRHFFSSLQRRSCSYHLLLQWLLLLLFEMPQTLIETGVAAYRAPVLCLFRTSRVIGSLATAAAAAAAVAAADCTNVETVRPWLQSEASHQASDAVVVAALLWLLLRLRRRPTAPACTADCQVRVVAKRAFIAPRCGT